LILSIIYVVFSVANAWQNQAVLQIQNKKQMHAYLEVKDLETQCQEESLYLVYPDSCYRLTKDLLRLGYINKYQASLREIDLEKSCGARILQEVDMLRLILLEKRVEPNTKCKSKIEDRVKDLLYSQG